jgi:hypothetical protein
MKWYISGSQITFSRPDGKRSHRFWEPYSYCLQQQEKLHANYAPFLDNQQSWMQLLVPAWDQTMQAQDMLKTFYKDSQLSLKWIIELTVGDRKTSVQKNTKGQQQGSCIIEFERDLFWIQTNSYRYSKDIYKQ